MERVSPATNAVKAFILSEFLPGEDPDNLTPKTPLISAGILDSLAILKMIVFLEQELNIHIEPHEVDVEQFNTIEGICALIDSKR